MILVNKFSINSFYPVLIALLIAVSSCKRNTGEPIVPPPVTSTSFVNPLLINGPDPWIIQKDTNYYYTHTLGNRIAIWKTSKISELRTASFKTIWSPPASGQGSRNIWAPEFHFISNKWYAYYAADDGNNANHRMFVLENNSPDPWLGTWEAKGKIADASNKWAIDGTVFDYGSQLYFVWSGWEGDVDVKQNLYIAKMSNPWTIEGNRVMISTPTYDWETIGAPDVNEGPAIIKNDAGKVFLTYSASGCWNDDYALGLLTLKSNGDPLLPADWIKNATPVFVKNPGGSVYGPGHNSFFKSKDGTENWILYHANSSPGQGCGDTRNPRAQKFTWNADGTPNFGQPVATGLAVKKPSGE
ncbi:MAG: glycoside hydrolase family 43 protein [Bacteroidota bacterium]